MATTPTKAGRRVLGDISVNTPSKSQTPRAAAKGALFAQGENYSTDISLAGRSVGQTRNKVTLTPGKDGSSIGKKRSIHEVEGIEQWSETRETPLLESTRLRLGEERVTLQRQESRETLQPVQSQQTDQQALDRDQQGDESVRAEESTSQQSTPVPSDAIPAPSALSADADDSSLPAPVPTHEEPVATTPPNNHATPRYHQDGPESATHNSFSSVIDYSPPDATTTIEPEERQEQEQQQEQLTTELGQAITGAASPAEALRLRLRVAMFKVQTNQTNVPLSELQVTPRTMAALLTARKALKQPSSAETPRAPSTATPALQPSPDFATGSALRRQTNASEIPSSPPASTASNEADDKADSQEDYRTPVAKRQRTPSGAEQLSSPPDSQEQRERRDREREYDAHLTSSVVRGRAATGLLDLMTMG